MGPRNRRRLAIGAGIAAVIIAVVAAVVLTRSTTPSGQAATPPPPRSGQTRTTFDYRCVPLADAGCLPQLGRVVGGKFVTPIDGMTKSRMLHLFGKPVAKRGNCWQYLLALSKYQASQHVVKDVLTFCFYEGRLANRSEQDFVRRHGKLVLWRPGTA